MSKPKAPKVTKEEAFKRAVIKYHNSFQGVIDLREFAAAVIDMGIMGGTSRIPKIIEENFWKRVI